MAKKIAFVSALGGQGCSLASVYVARAAAFDGHSVTLIDLGGFGGTLADMLGAGEDAVMNLSDVAAGECTPEDALTDCGDNLKLLPSCGFSERAVSPCSAEVIRTVEALAQESDVFADFPSGTVPDSNAADCFDMFVICSENDPLSLKYASALCRLLRKAVARSSGQCEIRLLLTRFRPESVREGHASDIDGCIDTIGAKLIGVLPLDSSAMECAMSGQPPDEKSELMKYAGDTARRIYGQRVPLDSSKPFRLWLL